MAIKKVSDVRLNKINVRRTLCESIEAGGFVSINFDVPCNATSAVLLGMVKQDVELYSVDLFQDGDPGGTKGKCSFFKGPNASPNVDLATGYTEMTTEVTAAGSAANFYAVTINTDGSEDITQHADTPTHVPIVMERAQASSNGVNWKGTMWFKQVDDVDKS
jgi:hypothetical protein